jgi:hypothetical protein
VRARLLAIFSPFLSAGFLAGAVLAQAGEQPVSFALKELGDTEEAKIGALVKRAVS